MKVALVAPPWRGGNDYPPLGLAYLASSLENAGYRQVRIFDLNLPGENVRDVAAFNPELVGITSMTHVHSEALETARKIRSLCGARIVMGGPHPTLFPGEVASRDPVDFVISGEGEIALVALVQALSSGTDIKEVPGLTFRDGPRVVAAADPAPIPELDALPFPSRHLLKTGDYPLRTPEGEPIFTVLSSRGCPYNCAYCFKGLFGHRYRHRSPENILAEIRHLKETYDARHFYFIDDVFMLQAERIQRICELILEHELDIRWQCLARVDRATPEILRVMHAAGCRRIHYGIESGVQEILDGISKGITPEKVRDAVRWSQTAGIRCKGYFMTGLPGDTLETLEQTLRFARSLNLDKAMFSITTPFPGTRLWDRVRERFGEEMASQGLHDAYYFCSNGGKPPLFFNLSNVDDATLVNWTRRANRIMMLDRNRRRYRRRFGALGGAVIFHISRIDALRHLGERAHHFLRRAWA
ncbi:MAG: B12-binding domain-containing radical SAM protein [Deltaproteobacteria bacterium]|nr:B12-binding domain-containing radical SAM protein [Deltaproteobacteria bacterium]